MNPDTTARTVAHLKERLGPRAPKIAVLLGSGWWPVAAGGRRVLAVAVCAVAEHPVTPCGGCRQRLREFAADDCPVWLADAGGLRATHTLGELLPCSFGPHHLPS